MAIQPFTNLKPSFPATINWSDSLAEGLVFYCLLDHQSPVDLVTGVPGVPSGGPTFRATQDGVAANLTSASSQYFSFAHRPIWNAIGPSTLLWRGSIATGSAYREFFQKAAGNGGANSPFDFRTDNAGTPVANIVRANAGGFRTFSGPAISLNTWHTIAGAFSDGTVTTAPTFMLDGTFSTGSNIDGGATGAVTGNTSDLWIGRRGDGAVQMDGVSSVVAVWGRRLTNSELIRLYRDPFSLLAPVGFRVRVRGFGTNLVASKAVWGWTGNAAAFEQEQHFTAETGTSGWTGNAPSMNAQSEFQAPSAAWPWIGNAAGGFGSNSQLGGMVYGAVRAIVRRGSYGAVNRRGVRNNK